MAYFALVTNIKNVRKDPNSDKLYLAECFREGVVLGEEMPEGTKVLYFPTDGKIERWFGNQFNLFRKNEDGTIQGGYLEDNGHVRAIKLRGNQSSGIVIEYSKLIEILGEDPKWEIGDAINSFKGKEFCKKYIPYKPKKDEPNYTSKKKMSNQILYPEFDCHIDTKQLAYNLNQFKEGDILDITLKMHGTSQRSMNTYRVLPKNWFRKLFHLKGKKENCYVLGTRRTVVSPEKEGFYGQEEFRYKMHEKIKPFVEEGMEVFYEIVGYYGDKETDTIMGSCNNTKMNDKAFVKKYGKQTVFSYGCKPGQCEMYVYRITSENGLKEFTPAEIQEWCDKAGVNKVPTVKTNYKFTNVDELLKIIDEYFEDLTDPIGKTHIKEGVVVRIVNRLKFDAYKEKTYEFKVLEGIYKETAEAPDMEEANDLLIE